MILKGLSLQALALVAVGSILGYAAATADKSNPALAATGSGEPISAPVVSAGEEPSCSTGLGRGPLLALAERNEFVASTAAQAGKKPNILVIFGDDVGITNISAYSDGLMGYETPNIDRIAKEGIRFLHYYGEQSCTAGRAAFLTGQHGLRTGLTKKWGSREA